MKFFSDISIYWLFPTALLSYGIAYLYYYKLKQLAALTKTMKWLLIFLRGSVLFLIILLLFGIIIERKVTKQEKPVFITLIDNSSSMLNYHDSLMVKNRIQTFQREVKEKFPDKFDFQTLLIGNEVQQSDSFSFSDMKSNLDQGFDYIYNTYYNKNIGAIAFFSDGNFNEGSSPVYSSKKINFTPIYTIGIGDTVVKKDQLIRNVSYNSIAFYKNEFPIEVDIEGRKMGLSNAKLSLWKDGKKIKESNVEYKDGENDFIHASFLVEANSVGFSEMIVKLDFLDGESSYENNEKRFYVETIDSRNKILLLSHAPHPDLATLKNELDKDEITEVSSKLISDFKGEVANYSLIIIQNPNEDALPIVNEAKMKEVPILYLLGMQTKKQIVDKLDIGLRFPTGNRMDEVQVASKSSFQLFDISDNLQKSFREWPPLTVPFGEIKTSNGMVLLQQRIGNVTKQDPVVYFSSNNRNKFGVIIGEGIWKWKMNDYLKHKNVDRFNEFIQKMVQYLTVKKNTAPLRIFLPNRFYTNKEIIINAEFYNSSFDKITTPNIQFKVKSDDGEEFKYEFAKNGQTYQLNIGQFPAGKYIWIANTNYDGKKYSKKGVFVVEDVSLEALSTHSNFSVLHQISRQSNASFLSLNELDVLYKDIENRKDIVNISYKESSFDDLIDWKVLFALIVLFLTIEWFIRRYSGGY